VQGTIQAGSGGPKRYVRFGSAKFAAEVLPEDQRSTLLQQVDVASCTCHGRHPPPRVSIGG
jgi:hypothetical protein